MLEKMTVDFAVEKMYVNAVCRETLPLAQQPLRRTAPRKAILPGHCQVQRPDDHCHNSCSRNRSISSTSSSSSRNCSQSTVATEVAELTKAPVVPQKQQRKPTSGSSVVAQGLHYQPKAAAAIQAATVAILATTA